LCLDQRHMSALVTRIIYYLCP